MPKEIEVTGGDEVVRMLDGIPDKAFGEVAIALDKAGAHLEGMGKRLAPVKEGFLRRSINHLILMSKAAGGMSLVAEVGAHTPYAKKQHDHPEYKHPKGGQAYYLTQPLRENVDRYMELIRAAVAKVTS